MTPEASDAPEASVSRRTVSPGEPCLPENRTRAGYQRPRG